MEHLVKSLNLKSTVEVKTKPPQYEAYVMSRDDPIIKAFDPVYRDVIGRPPVYQYAYGITDANTFAGIGRWRLVSFVGITTVHGMGMLLTSQAAICVKTPPAAPSSRWRVRESRGADVSTGQNSIEPRLLGDHVQSQRHPHKRHM